MDMYAKLPFVHKYAQKCTNVQKKNSHKHAFSKQAEICVLYAQISIICLNMHKDKYAILCKFKYAFIFTKYVQTCENMQ